MTVALTGSIDLVGRHRPSGGWLLCGWLAVSPGLAKGLPLGRVRGRVDGWEGAGRTLVALFERAGLERQGTGVLLFIEGGEARPRRVVLEMGRQSCELEVVAGAHGLSGARLVEQCRLLLGSAVVGQVDALGALLAQRGYAGSTELAGLAEPTLAGVDELIVCAPTGAVVIGWALAGAGVLDGMALWAGDARWPIGAGQVVRVARPDVMDTVGDAAGYEGGRCGFVAFVDGFVAGQDDPAFLTLAGRDGGVGYVAAPVRRLRGLAAIRRLLGMVELRGEGCLAALDGVVGPAVQRLQAERRLAGLASSVVQFGEAPVGPRYSLVVPLHRRIDYLEFQVALLPAGAAGWDLVWVLDDPPRREEALALAASVFARFGVPFRMVLLDENAGFAAASNAGLAVARGVFVGFMNSDVFPGDAGFMDGLAAALERDPGLGAVGPLLLFEDGSVQHEGMVMEAQPAFGGLRFPIHARKGRRPVVAPGVERWPAITGACLVMRRALAVELGGFDEDFVLGDFEDAALCERLAARGLAVGVDRGVWLYHLERQSQASPEVAWRRNLTAYNAWLHETKRA